MEYQIGFEQEDDGRWIAEIPALPGVMAYGSTRREAESRVEEMAELDQRMARYEQDPSAVIAWEQVKAKLFKQ